VAEHNFGQTVDSQRSAAFIAKNITVDEIVSVLECKQYLEGMQLSDEQMKNFKNNLIGVVDCVLSAYLDDFR